MNYIDLLWNKQANYMIINRQLKMYLGNKYRYTYKGIHNALVYYYDVTKHPVQMEYNSIGIVPYCYDKAQTYFKKIADARERNKNVGEINTYVRDKKVKCLRFKDSNFSRKVNEKLLSK